MPVVRAQRAGRYAEGVAKRQAEMRGAGKAPAMRDLGDADPVLAHVQQIGTAALQPFLADVPGKAVALRLEKPLGITRRQPRQSGDIAQGQLLHRQPRVDGGRDPPEMRDLNGRHPAVVEIRLMQERPAQHVEQGAFAGGKVLPGQRVELRAENRQHRPRHIGGNRPAQHQRPRQPLSAEPGRDAVGRQIQKDRLGVA
nr:hypothetical protein [Rhodovulum viride]